jgi:hypothetical protein
MLPSFINFIGATEGDDMEEITNDIATLAQNDKLYFKSITQVELENLASAAEYMLNKDAYKAAEEE